MFRRCLEFTEIDIEFLTNLATVGAIVIGFGSICSGDEDDFSGSSSLCLSSVVMRDSVDKFRMVQESLGAIGMTFRRL